MPATSKLPLPIWLILIGLATSSFLVVLVLIRYPENDNHLKFGLLALGLIFATAAFVFFLASRSTNPRQAGDITRGITTGLVTGTFWILEISFNNFVDPIVSTHARDFVDDGIWALIALAIFVSSLVRSLHTRSAASALRVGVWSGLVSGLLACIMGLLLITVWMPYLLRDPVNIAEYAVRGVGDRAPDMSTYFAYETLTGALGHLIVLGLIMGALLGACAGLSARVVQFRSPS